MSSSLNIGNILEGCRLIMLRLTMSGIGYTSFWRGLDFLRYQRQDPDFCRLMRSPRRVQRPIFEGCRIVWHLKMQNFARPQGCTYVRLSGDGQGLAVVGSWLSKSWKYIGILIMLRLTKPGIRYVVLEGSSLFALPAARS